MAEPGPGGVRGEEDLPAFSVNSVAHEIAAWSIDGSAGRFRGRFVGGAVLATIICTVTVFAFLLALTRQDPGSVWITVVMIAGSILSLVALYALGASVADEFHRTGIGVWACVIVFGASLFLAGWWLLFGIDLADDETAGAALPYVIEPTVMGAIAAASGIIGLTLSIRRSHRAAPHPPSAQARGVPGTIVSVPAPSGWERGNPRFSDVMVSYPDAGGAQTLVVTMRTTPQQVPVAGSSVLVRHEQDGRVRVEPDPERPMVFDPETAEYEDPGPAASPA